MFQKTLLLNDSKLPDSITNFDDLKSSEMKFNIGYGSMKKHKKQQRKNKLKKQQKQTRRMVHKKKPLFHFTPAEHTTLSKSFDDLNKTMMTFNIGSGSVHKHRRQQKNKMQKHKTKKNKQLPRQLRFKTSQSLLSVVGNKSEHHPRRRVCKAKRPTASKKHPRRRVFKAKRPTASREHVVSLVENVEHTRSTRLTERALQAHNSQHQSIIVRLSTDHWCQPLQLYGTCIVPLNIKFRDLLFTDVQKENIQRIPVDAYYYKGVQLNYRWKVNYGDCTLFLPETELMRDFFRSTAMNSRLNRRVSIEMVRKTYQKRVSLTERMTKWRTVAHMIVLYAKMRPKINLSIMNLGGDTTHIVAYPSTTVKEIRRRYCEKTGLPRTPQVKLFIETEDTALRLSAVLKDYPNVIRHPTLYIAKVAAWEYFKRV